jgi:hypothetical protein
MRKLIVSVFACLGLFSACAPVPMGASVTTPINLDSSPSRIASGSTWYFLQTLPASIFGLDFDPDFPFFAVVVGQKVRTPLPERVQLSAIGLPDDWGFRVYLSNAMHEVVNVREANGRRTVTWREHVELTFRADVPPTTNGHTYPGVLRVTINRITQDLPVLFIVDGGRAEIAFIDTAILHH